MTFAIEHERCAGCGRDIGDALVFTEARDGNKVAFGGYQCMGCGRLSYRSSPLGPEITEARWRIGMLSKELGFDVVATG